MQKTIVKPPRPDRLDSWKAIADYLGRSSRTVQRWHRAYGLPVRRLGGDSGSVFAYAEELEIWLRSREGFSKAEFIEGPALDLEVPSIRKPELVEAANPAGFPPVSGVGKRRAAALVASGYKLWTILSAANVKMIARAFREAIDLDPGNAKAFAGLSELFIVQGLMGSLRIPEAYASAKMALERALEIDAKEAESVCAAAWLKIVLDRDWHGARVEFEGLLAHESLKDRAAAGRALLCIAEGDPQSAVSLLQQLAQTRGLNSCTAALCAWSKYLAGEFWDALDLVEEARCSGHAGPVLDGIEALASMHCEEAGLYMERIGTLAAESAGPALLRGILGYAFALNGQTQKAHEILSSITHTTDGKRSGDSYAAALILVALNENRDAVQWLEHSYRRGSLWSLGFSCDPILQPLRDEPAYRALLSRGNYPAPNRNGEPKSGPDGAEARS